VRSNEWVICIEFLPLPICRLYLRVKVFILSVFVIEGNSVPFAKENITVTINIQQ